MTLYQQAINRKINGESAATTYGSNPVATTTWDAHRIQGCVCDVKYYAFANGVSGDVSDFEGFDCSKRTCPTGPNPIKCPRRYNRRQTVTCVTSKAADAKFVLSFRDAKSDTIPGNAKAADVKAKLDAMTTIGSVKVTFKESKQDACGASQVVTVEFETEFGEIPKFKEVSKSGVTSLKIAELACTPTGCEYKTNAVCSGAGICDSSTGLCKCFPGYTSSDGNGNPGTRGDCGAVDTNYGRHGH